MLHSALVSSSRVLMGIVIDGTPRFSMVTSAVTPPAAAIASWSRTDDCVRREMTRAVLSILPNPSMFGLCLPSLPPPSGPGSAKLNGATSIVARVASTLGSLLESFASTFAAASWASLVPARWLLLGEPPRKVTRGSNALAAAIAAWFGACPSAKFHSARAAASSAMPPTVTAARRPSSLLPTSTSGSPSLALSLALP